MAIIAPGGQFNVLVGCEFSGVVTAAFLRQGVTAMSCDLLPTDGGVPHYQGNVEDLLIPGIWDLIIMHPDCTAVCNAGNRHYGEGKPMHHKRLESAEWIGNLWRQCKKVCKRVCFENPAGVLPALANLPTPQFVQPYMFGHREQKRTGLYLHGLSRLKPTKIVYEEMMRLPRRHREAVFYMGPSADRWKLRATTYWGIGDAMSRQWR